MGVALPSGSVEVTEPCCSRPVPVQLRGTQSQICNSCGKSTIRLEGSTSQRPTSDSYTFVANGGRRTPARVPYASQL